MFNKSNNSWNDDRCAIRLWLNDTFINEAFIEDERRMLENRIGDEVFLLSIEEAYRYFKDDADRFLPDDEDNFGWWLRSEGAYSDHAACVDSHYVYSGHISDEGGLVYIQRGFVLLYGSNEMRTERLTERKLYQNPENLYCFKQVLKMN